MQLLITLILQVFLSERSLGNEAVPAELRRRVRAAQTFNDLLSVTQLAYAPHLVGNESGIAPSKRLKLGHVLSSSTKTEEVKLHAAALVSIASRTHSNFRLVVDENTRNDLEILSTIRQGNDTCKLLSVCVPVPVDNPDPGLLVFPRCYEVTQCVGSCCDSAESCHPTNIEYLQRPIVEMLYAGNNLFMINKTVNITIEQHLTCSCRECTQSGGAFRCPRGKIVGPNCNCECENKQQKRDCQEWNKVWDGETCTCTCAAKHCHGNTVLDPHTCLCRHRFHQQSYADPDVFGNYRSDPARLQKLRLSSRPRP